MRFIHKTAVAGAAMVAFAGIGAGTALADPPSGTTPAAGDIVGVGSDTTTPLFAGPNATADASGVLQSDYNTAHPAPAPQLWSWNATGSSSITPKTGCASIPRPNGSSAGITALVNSINLGNNCIDFARSSRARNSSDPSSISFVTLARDAITWSSPAGSGSPVPASLTIAQLAAIYSCTDTNWNQVGGANAPIVPVLPQTSSGTRATFLADIGGGVNNPLVPGPCVVNGSNSAGLIEENTGVATPPFGNTAQFGTTAAPNVDDIFPYSIGDYIAQATTNEGTYNGKAIGNHPGADFGHGPMALHEVGGVAPTTTTNTAPYANNAVVINAVGGVPMQRLLYDVFRTGSPLTGLFGPNGFMCTNPFVATDIISYGFLTLGPNCGMSTGGQ
jgi:ABC-type phosphate transport system substrate-binding protein